MVDPITGDLFISDMISKVENSDEGAAYHTYYWPKVIAGEPKLKTSYLLYNESVNLFIGTGVYYEDYLSSVQIEFFNRVRMYYENTDEYVYLYGYDGTPYIHKNPNLTKEDVLSVLDKNGDPLHYSLIKGVQNEMEMSTSVQS